MALVPGECMAVGMFIIFPHSFFVADLWAGKKSVYITLRREQ